MTVAKKLIKQLPSLNPKYINIQQLLNKADQDMKNSADRGGCYPRRSKAKVDNTLRDLQ